MDVVSMENLRVSAPALMEGDEIKTYQNYNVSVDLHLPTINAAISELIADSIDLDLVAAQIAFVFSSCRFVLLETAAHTLARLLLLPPVPVARQSKIYKVRIRLKRSDETDNIATASIDITRVASWAKFVEEKKTFGTVDIIHETADAGVYRLNIAPYSRIPMHVHQKMRESEFILTSGLLCQHQPAPKGSVRRWPFDTPHLYENPGDRWQSILCIDIPRFEPSDEILVSRAAVDVPFLLRPSGRLWL
jgi:dihydroneopterin aldolase